MNMPTPAGVPVTTTSPGSNAVNVVTNSRISGISKMPMPLARWWGFGLVWLALVLVLTDLGWSQLQGKAGRP